MFGNAVTAFGNVAVTTAEKKHGAGSAVFDGNGDYFAVPNIAMPDGTEDFTIEAWIRVPSPPATNVRQLYSQHIAGATALINFELRSDGKIAAFLGATNTYIIAQQVIPLNTWTHCALVRNGSLFSVYIDGGLEISATSAGSLAGATSARIGREAGVITTWDWFGCVDDFRITKGVARYTENFTPPGAIEYFNWDDPANITPSVAESYTFAPYAPPRAVHLPTVAPDPISGIRGGTEYGGRGRIVGTVKNKGEPSDTPVYRRVRLFKDRDGQCVAETWSDPVMGAYAFENINPAHKYTALSYDHTGQFRAVVADNLTPEVF